MKNIILSILLTIAFIGCDNLSPEEELDARLQGKWRPIRSFSGWGGGNYSDTTSWLIQFNNGTYFYGFPNNLNSFKYNIYTESGKKIMFAPGFPSIVTDSLGNTKEVPREEKLELYFTHNDTLNIRLLNPNPDETYLTIYVRKK